MEAGLVVSLRGATTVPAAVATSVVASAGGCAAGLRAMCCTR
jgi:hypothetical protein